MSPAPFEDDEPPLDPAVLRVQARLKKLMLIGGLTLGLGIAAVLIAVVYRFFIIGSEGDAPIGSAGGTPGAPVIGEVTAEAIGLPPGAELLSVTLDGPRLALAFRAGTDTVTVLVETTTMTVVGQFRVRGE